MAGYGGESGTTAVHGRSRGRNAIGTRRPNEAQKIDIDQIVDNSLVEVFTSSTTKAKGALPVAQSLSLRNTGNAALGAVIKISNWTDATTQSGDVKLNFIIPVGETLRFPSARVVSTDEATFLAGTAISNVAPDSNMYVDSTADADSATAAGVVGHATSTRLYLEPYTSAANCTANLFRVGDLIRIRDEVMEVTALGDKSDLANNYLDVIRGVHGSSSGTAAVDDDPVRLAFFNVYHPFTAATGGYDKVQTDNDGKFAATNFFGYGRSLIYQTTGIQEGSVAIKCYGHGYQELGMSGITPGTNSGLEAGGSFWLKIAIDGSTAESINFTVDANNTNFGGRNGVLGKIQAVLNEKYYNTSANIFEKKATVGIVNGDIRFTSGSRLSTSAIALTAGADGASASYNIFAQQNGRFPILAKIEDAVASRLPDDTYASVVSATSVGNTDAFMYDDGKGNLIGKGSGSINYDSGAIAFTSYPNTEFVVSAVYGSAMSGAMSSDVKNVIEEVKVQSLSSKIQGKVNVQVENWVTAARIIADIIGGSASK